MPHHTPLVSTIVVGLVLAFAAVFVLILALAASLLPARRAASIDPMKALRAD